MYSIYNLSMQLSDFETPTSQNGQGPVEPTKVQGRPIRMPKAPQPTQDPGLSNNNMPPVDITNSMKPRKKKKIGFVLSIILGFILAGALGGGYWYLKSQEGSKTPVVPNSNSNESAVKVTEIMNPLTGKMFPETAANWFEDRPFGVMMNNHVDARPQSGLIYADIVYEVVAEGGITRFLTFFYSNTPEKIGPVRSTREYYLVLVKELGDAMIMHDGYSPQALFAIENWPVRSLFRGGATLPSICDGCVWRDNPRDVAYEHTEYTNGVKLRELGDSLGWEGQTTVRPWLFKDSSDKYAASSSATDITIDYWYHGDYTGAFKFDPTTNTYLRYTGIDANDQPIPQLDQETKEQVAVKNLIIQFAVESSIAGDDKSRLEYELLGSGKALVFIDGKVVDATWSKAGRDERTIFYDTAGNEVEFNRGNFWIGIVPDRNVDQVVYK